MNIDKKPRKQNPVITNIMDDLEKLVGKKGLFLSDVQMVLEKHLQPTKDLVSISEVIEDIQIAYNLMPEDKFPTPEEAKKIDDALEGFADRYYKNQEVEHLPVQQEVEIDVKKDARRWNEYTCPKCKSEHELYSNDKYCAGCGVKIKWVV